MKKSVILLASICLFCLSLVSAAGSDLPPELAAAIKNAGFNHKGIGLFIQGIDDKKPIVAFQADAPLNPASVIKLVTIAAALGQLGAGYRWTTDVAYTGHLNGDTLKGNLYFRGNGDPYMTPERFWLLLNRLAIFGIHNISGNVVFDNSYFDPGSINYAAFDEQPYRTYNVGPNAMLVGFQATEFHFNPNGKKVDIIHFPDSPKLQVINKVKLTNGGCGAWQKRLSLDTQQVNGTLQVVFKGRYARAGPLSTFLFALMATGGWFAGWGSYQWCVS
jgi:D-alanyl-D-alanine carboxypeptidase/D-alanyl-D-alanine-endopeptidase (penicillin-binding protein 4)